DGRGHPMRSLGGAGVWEIYVPGAGEGARYKFDICAPDGQWRRKADPMANLAERPPATACVVYNYAPRWGGGVRGRGAVSRSASTRCTSDPGARACPTLNSPRN